MMLVATIVLCVVSQQLELAKEQLFSDWTTSSSIPNVLIGLPSENEVSLVAERVERIRASVIASTGGELTASQRELDVPFMMAMIDGITMEYAPSFAEKCIEHISVIDVELTGIAASRVIRMQHRAAVILGDEEEARRTRTAFSSLTNRHPEDSVVFTLFDIQQQFNNGNIERARGLYDKLDSKLTTPNMQYLRKVFADGYARLAPTTAESLYGWFSLADWLAEYGYDQKVIDAELCRWIERLPHAPIISEQCEDPRIASLAMRIEISESLRSNIEVALDKLMILARAGDGRAAEQVLEHGNSEYTEEAIQLVFRFPKRVHASLDYWNLYAARLDYRNRNFEQAIDRISEISLREGIYRANAVEMINLIRASMQPKLTEAVESLEIGNTVIPYQPHVIQELIQQCIYQCHENGIDEQQRHALSVLLKNAEHVSPSVIAEGYRLLGQFKMAASLFQQAIERDGPTVQTTAGLADCSRDYVAMRRVLNSTSPNDVSSYWFWISNVRVLQWFVEDGGNAAEAIAMVNRLRKKDASLGGAQFMPQFNALIR